MKITAKFNIHNLIKDTRQLEKKHSNLIVRNAFMDAAFRTQRLIRLRAYPKAFNPRNKGHVKAVSAIGAGESNHIYSKQQIKTRLTRRLSSQRRADLKIFDATGRGGKGKEYNERHARGGIKTAIDGRHIAVPNPQNIPRGPRGIRKTLRPTQLLAPKKGPRAKPGFIIKKGGKDLIVRRTTKERYPLEPMYLLVPSVRIPRSFPFYEDGSQFTKLFRAAYVKEYNFRVNRIIKKKY